MAQFFSGRGNSFKCLRFGRGRGAGALKRGRYLGLLSGIVGHGLLGWPALVRPILVAECAETLGNHDGHNGESGSALGEFAGGRVASHIYLVVQNPCLRQRTRFDQGGTKCRGEALDKFRISLHNLM